MKSEIWPRIASHRIADADGEGAHPALVEYAARGRVEATVPPFPEPVEGHRPNHVEARSLSLSKGTDPTTSRPVP